MEQQKDNVGVKHPKYDEVAAKRAIFEDVCDGTLRLREKGKIYLPQFPRELKEDWEARVATATCFNVTAKTVEVMTGLLFKEEITLESDVAPGVAALWESFDNEGNHGNNFMQDAVEESFEGFSVILVDAPTATAETLDEQIALGIRPYAVLYDADSVWTWSYRVNPISKKKELEMINLRECSTERVGNFTFKEVVRHRVFRMDEKGVVSVELWLEVENAKGEKEYRLEFQSILEKLTEIPVAIIGEIGEEPPLLDVALINIKHFQQQSDYDSILHKTCVPQLVLKGLERDEAGKAVIAPSMAWVVGPDGDVSFAEVQGGSIDAHRTNLGDVREQMALLGLSMLADKTVKVDVTATEALLNNIGETAGLRRLESSAKDALERSLGHMAEYLGADRSEGGSVLMGSAWSVAKREADALKDQMANTPNTNDPNAPQGGDAGIQDPVMVN